MKQKTSYILHQTLNSKKYSDYLRTEIARTRGVESPDGFLDRFQEWEIPALINDTINLCNPDHAQCMMLRTIKRKISKIKPHYTRQYNQEFVLFQRLFNIIMSEIYQEATKATPDLLNYNIERSFYFLYLEEKENFFSCVFNWKKTKKGYEFWKTQQEALEGFVNTRKRPAVFYDAQLLTERVFY